VNMSHTLLFTVEYDMWIDPVWDDADVSIHDSENFSGSSSHITVLWSALLVIYTNAGLWLKFQS